MLSLYILSLFISNIFTNDPGAKDRNKQGGTNTYFQAHQHANGGNLCVCVCGRMKVVKLGLFFSQCDRENRYLV